MNKLFLVVVGVVAGAVLGVAIITTAVFIREKNMNNQFYDV
jgi:hypothetical protein